MATAIQRREGVYWTTMEWNRLVKALDEAYPDRTYKHATSVSEVPFSLAEMNTVIKKALLPNRQRIIKDSYKFKKGLLMHLAKQDTSGLRKDPVIWTEAEWRQLALLLAEMNPEKDLLSRINMDCLVSADIEAAMNRMPEDRRRSMHLGFMREKLAGIYKTAREANDPDFQFKLTPPAAPEPEAPVEKPRKMTLAEISKLPKTVWKTAEWVQVAEEMIRLSPKREAAFLRGDLGTVSARDVRDAQLVLPESRRRNKALADVATLRRNLAPAFEYIAKERRAAEQHANDEKARAARIETVAPPAPEPQPEPAPEPQAAQAAPEPGPAPAAEPPQAAPQPELLPAMMPAVNPWEATFKPMMAQLTTQFANAFAPLVQAAMAQGLQQAITQGLQAMPTMVPQPPAPTATPDAASQAAIDQFKADNPMPRAAPPRPKIGVVGPLPQQARELSAAYPHLQITCVDSADTQERAAVKNCERVIGMTKFMNHSADAWLAQNIPHYTRVTGGVTAIKHQIDTWIKAGVLPGERRTEARA